MHTAGERVASYRGHVGGGKSGLVSTVCACVNDSRNFSQTSPIIPDCTLGNQVLHDMVADSMVARQCLVRV